MSTQYAAYDAITKNGTKERMQDKILDVLEISKQALSTRQIAIVLNKEPHQISTRLSELVLQGKVKKAGVASCNHTQRTVTTFVFVGRDVEVPRQIRNIKNEHTGITLKDYIYTVWFEGNIVFQSRDFEICTNHLFLAISKSKLEV
jgi:hypothetical protein